MIRQRSPRSTPPAEVPRHRPSGPDGREAAPTAAPDTAGSAAAYTGTAGWGRRRGRRDIPALPFCTATLRSRRLPIGYPNEMNTLGDHLQKRRLDLNLLWKDVATEIGTDATNVAYWRRARTTPGLKFWASIIRFLGYDPRPAPKTLGQALRRHRTGQGVSQKELANQLKVDPSTLARWEREERIPVGEFQQRVLAVLERVIGGDPPAPEGSALRLSGPTRPLDVRDVALNASRSQ